MSKVIFILVFIINTSALSSFTNIGYSKVTFIENEPLEDVNETLIEVIEGRGLVISYTSHANTMLERTSPQIDKGYDTYKEAFIHLFCSAELAHKMTKSNPHSLTGCPYPLAIYTLSSDPKKVYMSFRSSDEDYYKNVISLLEDIVNETKDEF
jgi:hypothetical protein